MYRNNYIFFVFNFSIFFCWCGCHSVWIFWFFAREKPTNINSISFERICVRNMNRPQKKSVSSWLTEPNQSVWVAFISLGCLMWNLMTYIFPSSCCHTHKKYPNCFVIGLMSFLMPCKNVTYFTVYCVIWFSPGSSVSIPHMPIVTVIIILYREKLIHPCYSIFFSWKQIST